MPWLTCKAQPGRKAAFMTEATRTTLKRIRLARPLTPAGTRSCPTRWRSMKPMPRGLLRIFGKSAGIPVKLRGWAITGLIRPRSESDGQSDGSGKQRKTLWRETVPFASVSASAFTLAASAAWRLWAGSCGIVLRQTVTPSAPAGLITRALPAVALVWRSRRRRFLGALRRFGMALWNQRSGARH